MDHHDDYFLWSGEIHIRKERGEPGLEEMQELGYWLWPIADEPVRAYIDFHHGHGGLMLNGNSFSYLKLDFGPEPPQDVQRFLAEWLA